MADPNAIRTMTEGLVGLRRIRDGALQTADSARSDETLRLLWLERAVEAQKDIVKLDAARTAIYDPCRKCGRRVSSPCHDAYGYREGGPWDFTCIAIFNPGYGNG